MPRTDLTILEAAAALVAIALSASFATARDREPAAQLHALQANEATLLKRDLHRAHLEKRDSARLHRLDELEREFQQAPRQPSGAYSAPPQPSGYAAPAETPIAPTYAQPPGWMAYGLGYWGVPPLCESPPRLHHRVALWRPPHAFHPPTVTCWVRPRTHRH